MRLADFDNIPALSKFDYWGESPDHPVSDWMYWVSNGDTRLGYWDWVLFCMDEYPQPRTGQEN
jgi:hypothetical protein